MSAAGLLEQVYSPGTDAAPRIADLNDRDDPSDLIHYVHTQRFDDAYLNGRTRFTALCGFQWGAPKPTDYVDGDPDPDVQRMKLCPVCHVLYERLSSGED